MPSKEPIAKRRKRNAKKRRLGARQNGNSLEIDADSFFRWRYGETDGWTSLLDDGCLVAHLVRKVMGTKATKMKPCGLMAD